MDIRYMSIALKEAKKAYAIGDIPVGAVIVNKSFLELLSETEEHKDDLEKIRELYSIKIKNRVSLTHPIF